MSRRIHLVERTIAASLSRIGVSDGDRILVALSGGADSVALTHALHRLRDGLLGVRFELAAAHLNHRLRGAESDRDERFVRELCERLEIELSVELADGLANSSNLEERARNLRYRFLNRAADCFDARYIALAHHADDQAETVMMRLLRGSGAAGLAAMESVGPGRIVRPMLTLRREQVVAYLDFIGQAHVIDGSNLSRTILRNRIRHDLLPMLERDYAPKLHRRLTGLALEMRSLDDYLAREARAELHRRLRSPDRLDLTGFALLHRALANATLREWLRLRIGDLRRIYRADIERMSRLCTVGRSGSIAVVPGGWRLRCEYGAVLLEQVVAASASGEPDQVPAFEVELSRDGVTAVPAAGFTFDARTLRAGDRGFPGEASMPRHQRFEALFDAVGIGRRLIVRGFRRGDRIAPLGMTGTRKIQDVFVDCKLVRASRATWPLIEADCGLLWVPGMVRSRHALVTSATQTILRLTVQRDATTENTSLLRI
ncbi:MAG TPA: tRNA lysidine(34) synthetase TilS [Candidatus Binataceae bacterium]